MRRHPIVLRKGLCLACCVFAWGLFHAWLFESYGLMGTFNDQNANLLYGRFPSDSLTPGYSQLGVVWHTMLHLLLAPVLAIPGVFGSPFAGTIVLLPTFVVGTVLLWQLVEELSDSKPAAFIAVIWFVMNPYVLYFATVPMTEVLFLTCLIGGGLYLLRWMRQEKVSDVVVAALCLSAATLTRIEGLAAVVVTGMLVAVISFKRNHDWAQSRAVLLLYASIGLLGLSVYLIGGLVFKNGDAWAFLDPVGVGTGAPAVPGGVAVMGWTMKLQTVLYAAAYQVSWPLVAVASLGSLLASTGRRSAETGSVAALLLAPVAFIVFAFVEDRIVIAVPGVGSEVGRTPFVDIRYVLPVLLPAIVLASVGLARLLHSHPFALRTFGRFLAAALIALIAAHYVHTVFSERLTLMQQELQFVGNKEAAEWQKFERDVYDHGKVLMVMYDNESFLASARIPFRQFIYESNNQFFEQTSREPWLFARWVIMRRAPNPFTAQIRQLTETPAFHAYFNLVLQTPRRDYFMLNESRLRMAARKLGIDPLVIPSLNPSMESWNPMDIYLQMQASKAK